MTVYFKDWLHDIVYHIPHISVICHDILLIPAEGGEGVTALTTRWGCIISSLLWPGLVLNCHLVAKMDEFI
jgi:hypothetical protein